MIDASRDDQKRSRDNVSASIQPRLRSIIVVTGAAFAVAGVVAGFTTSKEVFSVALLALGALGLLIGLSGNAPIRAKIGNSEIEFNQRVREEVEQRLEVSSPPVRQELASILAAAETNDPIVRRALRFQYTDRLAIAVERLMQSDPMLSAGLLLRTRSRPVGAIDDTDSWLTVGPRDRQIMLVGIYSGEYGLSLAQEKTARKHAGVLFVVKEPPLFEPSFAVPPWRSVVWESAADDGAIASGLKELLSPPGPTQTSVQSTAGK